MVIIHEHKIKADRAVMNSEQRLELARLHSAAEFGAACLEGWDKICVSLRIYIDERGDREDTAILNRLMYLYEVAK